MRVLKARATASPNIAFIKYWGNLDDGRRLPANGSISMTLAGLETVTDVTIDPSLTSDMLWINGEHASPASIRRASGFLDYMRDYFGHSAFCTIESSNNFPTGTGIASSASAYAALAAAYVCALGESVSRRKLSILSRHGSGSASRSIFGGFVEWITGATSEQSYSFQIAPPAHWELVDLIAIIGYAHKTVGSSSGHHTAHSSPLQEARISSSPERLNQCRKAILNRDFDELAAVAELDSNLLHAVMMTSNPPLLYWQPATITVMKAVREWRNQGLPVFYTIDAGPNVHCLTTEKHYPTVLETLQGLPGIKDVLIARPGQGIRFSSADGCYNLSQDD